MSRRIPILLILFVFFNPIQAQEMKSLQEIFIEGEYFFVSEDYADALPYYLQIIEKVPDNANISYRKYVIDLCNFLSVNLFLFDYRGYGKSTGIPSPGSICADGMIAYNYLRTFCSPQNIYLWGESLGGAAAVHIASQAVCARLICMCTFSSLDDIVVTKQSVQRWIGIALSTVVKTICDVLPSSTKISGVTCPIVVIHSIDDEIIPFECVLKLYSSISHDDKLFLKIRGEHSSPEITQEQMFDLVRFCGFSQNVRKSQNGFLEDWLDKLKNNVFEQV